MLAVGVVNGRMYLAGYHGGRRLAGVAGALEHSRAQRDKHAGDAYLVSLGLFEYEDGFEDAWHGRPQVVAGPLESRP